ncbi:hypothetical protein F5B19DRAFT_461311 [Rostrohypoxylon terebratum]|nr:hypothetical protein F5B19DRAFT_461311 [Rostrohypoxylon terebratum]
MAKSSMPLVPKIVFGVVEPAMRVWAYISCLSDPTAFFAAQAPPFTASAVPPQALVPLLQLANVYLLLAALAVLCAFTSHRSIARWYLVAVALADYGHVWATYRGVGEQAFWNVSEWNDMLWGGVGVSAVLNVLRWLTVLGAFGRLRDPRTPGLKKSL